MSVDASTSEDSDDDEWSSDSESSSASEPSIDSLRSDASLDGDASNDDRRAWNALWGNGNEKEDLRRIRNSYGPQLARRVAAVAARSPFPTAEGAFSVAFRVVLEQMGLGGLSFNPFESSRKMAAYRFAAEARAAAVKARAAFISAYFPPDAAAAAAESQPPASAAAAASAAALANGDGAEGARARERSGSRKRSPRDDGNQWAFYQRRKQKNEQETQSLQQRLDQLRPQLQQALLAADDKHAKQTRRLAELLREQARHKSRFKADPLDERKVKQYTDTTALVYRARRRLQHIEWRRASVSECMLPLPVAQQRL